MKWIQTSLKKWRLFSMFLVPSLMLWAMVGFSSPSESAPPFVKQWGSQGSGNGQFIYPYDVALDASGYVYVVELGNRRVQKFDRHGRFLAKFGSPGNGDGQFIAPRALAVDGLGNFYVVDSEQNRVQKFDANGNFLLKWGSQGSGDGQFSEASGIAISPNNQTVYVVDRMNTRIQKFDSNGTFLSKWGEAGDNEPGKLKSPTKIAVDSSGNVYVTDNERIKKFDSNGAFLLAWGEFGSGNGQFNFPFGIATDQNNNVYVGEWAVNHRIQKFDSNGLYLTQWGSQGSDAGQFSGVYGLAVAANGNVYVADTGNNRIQIFGVQEADNTIYLPFVSQAQSGSVATATPTATRTTIPALTATPSPTGVASGTPSPTSTPPTPIGPTGLVCNPSGGSGGLAAGTTLTTTFNNYPLMIKVSKSYTPRAPGYLTIYLHGDEGNNNVPLVPVAGGVYLAPQSPATNGIYHEWWALPEQNSNFLVALFQDVFAKYNLCQNVIFGGSVSGGSVFYDRVFYPTQGGSYPAFWSVNCGGGLSQDARTKLQALSQQAGVVARTEFSYTIGSADFLYPQTSQSADYRQSLGFAVGKNYLPNIQHCAYNTAQVIQAYFEAKTIEMNGRVNRPPVTNDDEVTTVIGRNTLIDVLRNDSDPNSDPISVTAVSAPALGTVLIQANQLLYTPTSLQAGQDSFTYTVSDGRGEQNSATVTVTLQINSPPTARDDTFTVARNSTTNRLDVLYNDFDLNDTTSDPLRVTEVSAASNGLVAIAGTHLLYTPTVDVSGSDTFTYTVVDPSNSSRQAVVTITISPTVGIVVNTTEDERNQDGDCSLREAIQAANSDTAVDGCPAGQGADTIYLPAGSYSITLVTGEGGAQPMGESNNLSGDFDILADLTIQGATAGSTILDGNHIDRIFHIARSNLKVTLQGLTMQNGRALAQITGGFITASGGGVLVAPTTNSGSNNGSLLLDGVFVRDTLGEGGVGVVRGALQLRNSTIQDNDDGYVGVFSLGLLTMTNTTLVRNGVVFGGTSAQILHTTVWLEDGQENFGIVSQGGTITVQNSAVFGDVMDKGCDTVLTGMVVSAGYNASNGSTCPFTQPGDQQNVTIGLVDTQQSGGTPMLAPRNGSVLRNAIPNGSSGCGTTVTSDQRGVNRPQENGCEIGAYEVVVVSP